MIRDPLFMVVLSATMFASVYLGVRYGWAAFDAWFHRQADMFRRALVDELLMDLDPRAAVVAQLVLMAMAGLLGFATMGGVIWPPAFAAASFFLPEFVIRYLVARRREALETQLVDGITTLASGVRAGLNLVQAMELLEKNALPPIKQEFGQLLREYQLGLDLNQTMRNTANRIGSQNYRLLFTAIEMHRLRGGDAGESLDRIAESIREIQRLEGKLDALTAQGRIQAWMMAITPFAFLLLLNVIDPEGVDKLFHTGPGRLLLLVALTLIVGSFFWIRRIMAVDI